MLLTNRYQEHIYFFNEPGQENVVYFKEMTDYLINEKYREKKTTVQEVSKRIQTLAANLIKPEIREREFNKKRHIQEQETLKLKLQYTAFASFSQS